MKIEEIDDMVTRASIEADFSGNPEILKMKVKLDKLTEDKIDNKIIIDVLDKSFQKGGYENFISFIKTQKYALKSTFLSAQKNNYISDQKEFVMLMNDIKNFGIFTAFLNIANEYKENSKFSKSKTEQKGNYITEEPSSAEKRLNREFDIFDYFLYRIKDKRRIFEPQRA